MFLRVKGDVVFRELWVGMVGVIAVPVAREYFFARLVLYLEVGSLFPPSEGVDG